MAIIGPSEARPEPAARTWLPPSAMAAALAAVLVYLSALDNPFVYDDYRLIVENTSLENLSNFETLLVRDVTRPVVNLSYALDTAIWGRNPFGYHLTNLLLHTVNVLLVYWVALLAAEDRKRQPGQEIARAASPGVVAGFTAMLFAVHPMLTQAVGYISARSEVAYGCLFLLAFLAGRRWMLDGGRRWWLACALLWVSAVLTKESAAMLPFVLLAYDWFVLDTTRADRRRRFLRMGLPLLAVTFLAGAGRLAVLRFVEYSTVGIDWRFALVAVDVFWRYLGMFAVPRDQAIFHAVPLMDDLFAPRALAGIAGLLAIVPGIIVLRRVHSLLAFGGLWFLLILVPSSVLFVLGIGEPMAEHRAYVAAVGLFLTWGSAFGILMQRVADRWRVRVLLYTIAGLFIAQLAVQTLIRNVVWGDPVALSTEAARLAPDHWMPRLLLGEAYRQTGRCEQAVLEYRAASSIRPEEEFPYTKLAGCLIEGRRLAEAETALAQLRVINPRSDDASMGLGVLAAIGNRPEEALRYFEETLARNPGSSQARQMLAFVEGSLPVAQHQRLCEEMRYLGQGSFEFDGCVRRLRDQSASREDNGL